MAPTTPEELQQERKESMERLYEDIRRAMNNRDFNRAAKLSLALTGELAEDEFIRTLTYPICLECNGFGEVVDPLSPERKAMCTSAPRACYGNKQGRMTPEQYVAYLDAKLAPLKPTRSESVAKPEVLGGEVPRLPPDNTQPTPTPPPIVVPAAPAPPATPTPPPIAYVYSRDEVIALNPGRVAAGLAPLPLPEEPPKIVPS